MAQPFFDPGRSAQNRRRSLQKVCRLGARHEKEKSVSRSGTTARSCGFIAREASRERMRSSASSGKLKASLRRSLSRKEERTPRGGQHSLRSSRKPVREDFTFWEEGSPSVVLHVVVEPHGAALKRLIVEKLQMRSCARHLIRRRLDAENRRGTKERVEPRIDDH